MNIWLGVVQPYCYYRPKLWPNITYANKTTFFSKYGMVHNLNCSIHIFLTLIYCDSIVFDIHQSNNWYFSSYHSTISRVASDQHSLITQLRLFKLRTRISFQIFEKKKKSNFIIHTRANLNFPNYIGGKRSDLLLCGILSRSCKQTYLSCHGQFL